MEFFARCLGAPLALLLSASLLSAASTDNLVLILDASGSMWGRVNNETKIEAARRVVRDFTGKLPAGAKLGLVAYGHRQKGDCNDIEELVAPGSASPAAVPDRVDKLNPLGMTPITKAFEQAAESAKKVGKPGTIVLVTDGLETCGGDPCAAVRKAKAAGMDFVLHVVGFDVAKENVSSLECSAQAGGGLYFPAENADDLSEALEQTMAEAAPAGDATLSVKSVVDGKLHDAVVIVRAAAMKEIGGRTYAAAETNPRTFALPAGTYDIIVRPMAVQGGAEIRFDKVVVEAGKVVEKLADFSTGELSVKVTLNGALSDATVSVHPAGQPAQAAAGRTYNAATSNPKVFRVPPGVYDVRVKALELANDNAHVFEKVEVKAGGRAERTHALASGVLKIGATQGGALIDAAVNLKDAAGQPAKGGRLYTDARTNPRSITLLPGKYVVTVAPVRKPELKARVIEVEVTAAGEVTKIVEW
jgi:Ca-activated chloride channel family protein